MGKSFSGLHPETREKIEIRILDTVAQYGGASTKELSLTIQKVSRAPLTQRRLMCICSSLRKKGVLDSKKGDRKTVWTLKQY